jgi:hypothetical protein
MAIIPEVVRITSSHDMFRLLDEMANDRSSFINSRDLIADAWRDGFLYGVVSRDVIPCSHPLFPLLVSNTSHWDLFPCLCVSAGEGSAGIMWVHTRARRRGLGRALVSALFITTVPCPLPGSFEFWAACGVTMPVPSDMVVGMSLDDAREEEEEHGGCDLSMGVIRDHS